MSLTVLYTSFGDLPTSSTLQHHSFISAQGIFAHSICMAVRSDAFGCGTALQGRRSRFRFPKGLLGCFIDPRADKTSNRKEYRLPVRRSDNLPTFMCRLSRNCGSLNDYF